MRFFWETLYTCWLCRYSPVGRSFYSPNLGTRRSLGDGLESWRGFYQSIRPTQMGLSLNIGKRRRPLTFKWLLYFDFCNMLQADFSNLWQHLDVGSDFCFQHMLSRKFGNFVPCDGKYLGFTSLDAVDSSNME